MRIGVTGGRDFNDWDKIAETLSGYFGTLVHGDAPGADRLCAQWWAQNYGEDHREAHPAPWDEPCRPSCAPGHRRAVLGIPDRCPAAGPYRNQEMVDSGLDLLIAFPGGRGTADMVARARAVGVRVVEIARGGVS